MRKEEHVVTFQRYCIEVCITFPSGSIINTFWAALKIFASFLSLFCYFDKNITHNISILWNWFLNVLMPLLLFKLGIILQNIQFIMAHVSWKVALDRARRKYLGINQFDFDQSRLMNLCVVYHSCCTVTWDRNKHIFTFLSNCVF